MHNGSDAYTQFLIKINNFPDLGNFYTGLTLTSAISSKDRSLFCSLSLLTTQIEGIMCTFSKFADVCMSDGCIDRKALQRGLDRLDWWAEAACMTFSKAMWWV